jgi:sterol desaturase/sphingolipid hydroxylase (fatty acid hydroxylase superfamily)
MSLSVLLIVTLGLSTLTMLALSIGFRLPASRAHRIREEKGRKLRGGRVVARVLANGSFSMGLVIAFPVVGRAHLFDDGAGGPLRVALEVVGVLALYDFAYYLLHRYPFHEWKLLKRVHAVHHRAKHPIAVDSLFLHPIENFLGLFLLHACVWVVGPVHLYSYGVILVVYTQLNIFVHSGLDLRGPLAPLGHLARKHDMHHASMRAGNYASITPLPDLLFGTAE